ncbi:hypothetical protein ACG02S_18795 [Roseateles sp. DC23W]|uniref:Uncharacterized protein n=1 Tax=Pelomonas dachongensis TaxID=3299029 RepID=A0ABW7ER07_9BURK
MSAQNLNNHTLTGPVVSHDFSPPSRGSRRAQMLALLAITAALLGSAAWHADSADMLSDMKQWRTQIARGLQVSLRAVADGRDHPASAPSAAATATAAVVARDVRPR